MAKRAVLAPFLGQLDRGFLQIAGKLLELAFEAFKKRDGVGGGAREAGDDSVIEKAARLARRVLHHVFAHGHLAIGDQHDLAVLAHAQNRGAVHLRASPAVWHPNIIAPRSDSAKTPFMRSVTVAARKESSGTGEIPFAAGEARRCT